MNESHEDTLPDALWSAVPYVQAPLLYKGKVRELYDLGEHLLIVVTDRISAFDFVLTPAIPCKGQVLNRMSVYWFAHIASRMPHALVHADVSRIAHLVTDARLLQDRVMVVRRAKRIDIECVVRGYVTGGGWRQYEQTGHINGIALPKGLHKNQKLPAPIFTPARKNDQGHDEDISYEALCAQVGSAVAAQLREKSVDLYEFAAKKLAAKGILLADCKFEFGWVDGVLTVIDEVFTPDSARLWPTAHYAWDVEIDSLDKEPVRAHLAASSWDRHTPPPPLPEHVVRATMQRYHEVERWICS